MSEDDSMGNAGAVGDKAAERMQYAEESLVKTMDAQRTVRALREQYGIGHRQAYRYVRAVRQKWTLESNDPRHRENMRETIREVFKRAIVDAFSARDIANVIRGARALAELEGVNEALRHKLNVEVRGDAVLQAALVKLTDARERAHRRNGKG
jgi:hypothetical protein